MATRSPGYNRLGLSIILSSLPLPSQGIFSFLHCTPFLRCPQPKVPPCLARAIARSASDLPSFRPSSCRQPVARSVRVFLCILSFFLKKKVRSERPSRWLPFLPKAIARSASPSFRSLSCHQPVARSVRVFLCVLSFSLKKKVRSERPSRWLPFLPKAIARSASPSFRSLSCHQPVARSVRVFLCILSFFLKKKVWEIPTKYGIMERIDEHLFRAAGGTQFF